MHAAVFLGLISILVLISVVYFHLGKAATLRDRIAASAHGLLVAAILPYGLLVDFVARGNLKAPAQLPILLLLLLAVASMIFSVWTMRDRPFLHHTSGHRHIGSSADVCRVRCDRRMDVVVVRTNRQRARTQSLWLLACTLYIPGCEMFAKRFRTPKQDRGTNLAEPGKTEFSGVDLVRPLIYQSESVV